MLALVVSPSAPHRLELTETADPSPASNEALVDVRATSVNRGDARRSVLPAPKPPWPEGSIPGYDLAGVIAEPAADGSGPPAGTRVAALAKFGGPDLAKSGGWAQRAAVPTDQLAAVPATVADPAATALPMAGLMALRALGVGGTLLGRRVLITGAAGGIGRIAVQLGRQAGAHITGVVSSPERAEGLVELGADETVTELSPDGEPYDLILEQSGGTSLAAAMQRVSPGGTIVTYGNSSLEPTSFSAFWRGQARAVLYGFALNSEYFPPDTPGRDLSFLLNQTAAGHLDPQVGLVTSWRSASDAIDALWNRTVNGKAILMVD